MKRTQQLGRVDNGFDEVPVSTLSGGAHTFGHNDPFSPFCKAKFTTAISEGPVRSLRRNLMWPVQNVVPGATMLAGKIDRNRH
jgi:hypothetical protein